VASLPSDFRDVESRLDSSKKIKGVSPRLIISGNCSLGNLEDNPACLIILQNTDAEKNLGIGRAWEYPPLKAGECHISGINNFYEQNFFF
jgi:hypothetical protein